jgi:hypothetical protein
MDAPLGGNEMKLYGAYTASKPRRVKIAGVAPETLPHLPAWHGRLSERPSVAA